MFLKYLPSVKVGGLDCTNIFLLVFKEVMHQPPGFQTMKCISSNIRAISSYQEQAGDFKLGGR
jgi:hypothetical protein